MTAIADQAALARRGLAAATAKLGSLGATIAPPVVRVALALPFLRSGLTRWDPFPSLSIGTQFLFETQFKLHIFGQALDLPAPLALAYLTAIAEIVLPVLVSASLSGTFPWPCPGVADR